jgi:hypothetical protein
LCKFVRGILICFLEQLFPAVHFHDDIVLVVHHSYLQGVRPAQNARDDATITTHDHHFPDVLDAGRTGKHLLVLHQSLNKDGKGMLLRRVLHRFLLIWNYGYSLSKDV